MASKIIVETIFEFRKFAFERMEYADIFLKVNRFVLTGDMQCVTSYYDMKRIRCEGLLVQ